MLWALNGQRFVLYILQQGYHDGAKNHPNLEPKNTQTWNQELQQDAPDDDNRNDDDK